MAKTLITTWLRCICLILSLAITVPALAQPPVRDDIQVSFQFPTGFIASGESRQLYLQVHNPADSGVTVQDISGVGGSYRVTPSGFTLDTFQKVFSNSPNCGQQSACPYFGSFPLLPGQTIFLAHQQIHAVEELPLGAEISVELAQVSLLINNQTWTVYSQNRSLHIVTSDGTGDLSVFDEREINLPPLHFPELEAVFDFPSSLPAGAHFNLRANIRNLGTVRVQGITQFPSILSSGSPFGSFGYVPCSSNCVLGGRIPLDPGQSLTLDLGSFYYENPYLESSALDPGSIFIRTIDAEGRHVQVELVGNPIQIDVVGPDSAPVENPARVIPVRVPLEIRDLAEGDQRLLHDPNVGSDWLRLHVTDGLSYDEMQYQLANEPLLAGFELARLSQVEELMLGYLHGLGISAASYNLYNTSQGINEALYDFLDLIGDTQPQFPDGTTSHTTGGLVADKPPLSASSSRLFSRAELRVNTPSGFFATFPRGLRTFFSHREDFLPHFESSYWLVRTNTPPVWIPIGATFARDELRIASIQIGDEYYAASFNFRDSIEEVLQLTELKYLGSGGPEAYAHFDVETGELLIPELVVCHPDGLMDRYQGRLTYIPESDPALFVIRESVLLNSGQSSPFFLVCR